MRQIDIRKFSAAAILFLLLLVNSVALANIDESASQGSDAIVTQELHDRLGCMTDEEFKEYSDSVYASLYQEAYLCKADSATFENLGAVNTINATASAASPVPVTVDLDRSKAVGEIVIKSGANQFGAKTYEVPITVYPGMHGMTPQISLSYNSMGGNSFLGMGWSISGILSINREPCSLYYSNETEPVDLSAADQVSLDGLKLLPRGVEYIDGTGVASYETEYGNIKAKSYSSGPSLRYFEVFYPDGRKAVFGDRNNSMSQLSYPITEMSDSHGNKITYSYTKPYGTYRIESIGYNGAYVFFKYGNREDILLSFCAGEKLQKQSLLTGIECRRGNAVLGTYKLAYTKKNMVSLLSQIDYESEGNSYNPIRLYYGEGETTSSFSSTATQLMEWYESNGDLRSAVRMTRGKFDYNVGDDGVVCYPNKNPYWLIHRHRDLPVTHIAETHFENKYTGKEKILLYTGLSESTATPMPNIITDTGFVDILCADLYGTQEENIIKVNNTVTGDRDAVTFHVYGKVLGSYGRLFSRTFDLGAVYEDDYGYKSITPKFCYAGDFTGDGKMEVLAVSAHQPFNLDNYEKGDYPSMCYLFDLVDNKILYTGRFLEYKVDFAGTSQSDPVAAANNSDILFVIDCDGDGKSELCHINASGTDILRFESLTGSYYYKTSYTGLKRTDLADRELLVGDFNGDGLADIAVSPLVDNSYGWYVHCSRGNGQFEKISFSGLLRNKGDDFMVQDINGDGISDIVRCHDNSIYPHLFSYNAGRTSAGFGVFEAGAVLVPVDINAHTQSAKLLEVSKGTVTKYSFSRNDHREALLTGVTSSLGIVEKNSYSFVNSEGIAAGIYTPAAGAKFPYVNISEAIPVIVSVQSYLNGELLDRKSYAYGNGVFHRQGRGFRGFEEVHSTDRRGHVTTSTYDVYGHSTLKSEKSPTFYNTYTYETEVDPFKVAKVCLKEKSERDLLRGVTVTTSIKSDEFGYPVEISASYPGDITTRESIVYAHESTVGDGYNLGFEESRTKVTTRDGSSCSEMSSVVSHSRGQPTSIYRFRGNAMVERERFSYDSCGNVLQHATLPYSGTSTVHDRYEYDRYGQVVGVSDIHGLKRSMAYDDKGNVISETDCRGNSSTYAYDSFKRLVKAEHPDGVTEERSYAWSSEGVNGLYAVTRKCTGEPTTSEIFDALGRTVRETDVRFNGSVRKTDRTYDAYGNLQKVSLPFTGTSANYWNTYTYDSYNRVTAFTEASGRKTTHAYANLSETTVENNISTRRTTDAFGNLVSVTDPGGTVTYELAADGQPISVTAPGGAVTTFKYDTARRRIEMNDPSKGVTKYEYDNSGNLSKETDANGKSVSYTYDRYGRLTGKTCQEFTAAYTYNEYGDLAKVSSDNGSSTEYSYDEYGRTASVSENAPGVSLVRRFAYSSGNVSDITYAAGTLVSTVKEHHAYTNGHLTGITLNDSISVFSLKGENALGMPIQTETGPLTRTYAYTPYGLPTGRKVMKGSTVIQDFSYSFDKATHNLTSRSDNTREKTESFTYDNLNRLISYGGVTATYDAKGNITSKGGIGQYSYGLSSKPYALTGVPSGTRIPSTLQEITYTSFSRPQKISEDGYTTEFTYNASLDRVRSASSTGSGNPTYNYYLSGCYEATTAMTVSEIGPIVTPAADIGLRQQIRSERFYLGGDYYDAPAVFLRSNGGKGSVYYILRDYLGSITHVVNSKGSVQQELSYDAWGSLRNPDTHGVYEPGKAPAPFLWRGYTGHEHLTRFGLVNMNARLYDPAVGRFLSPDPLVQMPDMTQNFNRYSYCLNNPLCYVDEDGEFFWVAVGVAAAIGAITNVGVNWHDIVKTGGWKGFWKGVGYFTVGGLAGGAGAAAGMISVVGMGGISTLTMASLATASSGAVAGATLGGTTGLVNGFLLNTSNSLLKGDCFGTALTKGIYGAATEGACGALLGGLSSGIEAIANKENFFTGAKDRLLHEIPASVTQYSEVLDEMPGIGYIEGHSSYTGYYGYDTDEVVRYVGTTTRDPDLRFVEHLKSGTERSALHFRPVRSLSSKAEMRIWEQMSINKFGLMKNGGLLLNIRNEIAPKYWNQFGIKP